MKRCMVWGLLLVLLALAGCRGAEPAPVPVPTEPAVTTALPTAPTTAAPIYPLTGYVNASTLNVRPTPDTSGYAIGGLRYGETVTIVGKEGDWYQIQFQEGTGYVSAQYIQMDVPGAEPPAETTTAFETAAAAETTVAVVAP